MPLVTRTTACVVLASGCGIVTNLDDLTSPPPDGAHGADSADVLLLPPADASLDADADAVNPCTGSADATLVADMERGFSSQQGQCAWSYGYFLSGTSAFQAFTLFDPTNVVWYLSGAEAYLQIGSTGLSPQGCDWPVLRWTSSVDGAVRFVGTFSLPSPGQPVSGNGVIVHFFVGTNAVYSNALPNTAQTPMPFDVTTIVSKGGYVYFAVDPNQCNSYYDTTQLTLQILSQ